MCMLVFFCFVSKGNSKFKYIYMLTGFKTVSHAELFFAADLKEDQERNHSDKRQYRGQGRGGAVVSAQYLGINRYCHCACPCGVQEYGRAQLGEYRDPAQYRP